MIFRALLQGKLNPKKNVFMKTKSIIKSGLEVMSATQLSKVIGGREVEVIIDGKKVIIIVPD